MAGDRTGIPTSADGKIDELGVDPALGGAVWQLTGRYERRSRGHRHPEWEFNLLMGGRATYLVGDRRVELRRGTGVWLLPTQPHLLLESSERARMWIAVIDTALIAEIADTPGFGAWAAWLAGHGPDGPLVRGYTEPDAALLDGLCRRLAESPPPPPARRRPLLATLFAEAWLAHGRGTPHPVGPHLHPGVAAAAAWLAEHAASAEADSITALAERVHVSRSHLSRLFHAQIGCTLIDFRNRLRVQRFIELGRAGHPLAEAADAAGFRDYTQAYRQTRTHLGRSPRAAVADRTQA